MTPYRTNARVAGALFLIAMVASLAGGFLVQAVLDAPGYLGGVSGDAPRLLTGMALEFVNAVAVLGIAVALFPVLKRWGEGAALGYVALRIVECAVYVAGAVLSLALIALGRAYLEAGAAAAPRFEPLGDLLVALREAFMGPLLLIFFSLGALVLYTVLIRSELVPRFISVWGLLAVAAVLLANLPGIGATLALILVLPIIANEVFLAIWLIVRGFDPAAFAPDSGDGDPAARRRRPGAQRRRSTV